MPRKATIGPEVYARVNELVGQGKNRTEAFAAVAEERRQRAGTVAANYYRTARSQGVAGRRQKRTAKAGPARATPTRRTAPHRQATASRPSNQDDLTAIAAQIATLTQELVSQIQARDAKLRALLG
jgi:hypothetical protein